eukprot:4280687-Prymnesium_polylepis.1
MSTSAFSARVCCSPAVWRERATCPFSAQRRLYAQCEFDASIGSKHAVACVAASPPTANDFLIRSVRCCAFRCCAFHWFVATLDIGQHAPLFALLLHKSNVGSIVSHLRSGRSPVRVVGSAPAGVRHTQNVHTSRSHFHDLPKRPLKYISTGGGACHLKSHIEITHVLISTSCRNPRKLEV